MTKNVSSLNSCSNRINFEFLSTKELAEQITTLFINNPLRQYIDVEKWLKSASSELIYKGKPAKYLDRSDKRWHKCLYISKKKMFKEQYCLIIVPKKRQIMNVPEKDVKYE